MADRLIVLGYPTRSIVADAGRAGLGMVLSLTPLAFGDVSTWTAALLGAAVVLFAGYGLSVLVRRRLRLQLTDDHIEAQALRTVRLSWQEVSGLSLAYFSTRRRRDQGWMQLRLRGEAGTIRCESSLDGFETVVRRAAAAARANGVVLDPATADNLQALGIAPA